MSGLTKSSLRKLIGESLRNIPEHIKQTQSDFVATTISKHPKYKSASRISLYLSTQDEIDTIGILRHVLEVDKKQCYIPLVSRHRRADEPRMRMVEIRSMDEYEKLPVNKYGIKEPDEGADSSLNVAKVGQLDLLLVPGVAFSRDGRRLGHGKGYYDEFLFHWSSSGQPVPYCIGLALREQIVADTLAEDNHDYKLDEVVAAPKDLSSLKK